MVNHRIYRNQRASVIVTALLFMSLAASLAVAMLFRQSISIDRTRLFLQQSVIKTALSKADTWAAAVLKPESASSIPSKKVTHFNQAWATPLEVEDGYKLKATIIDVAGLWNINNLYYPNKIEERSQGKKNKSNSKQAALFTASQIYGRLLMQVAVEPRLSLIEIGKIIAATEAWVKPIRTLKTDEASSKKKYQSAHSPLASFSENRLIDGVTDKLMLQLETHATVIPVIQPSGKPNAMTKININTTNPEILAAITLLQPNQAEALLSKRPFESIEKLKSAILVLLGKKNSEQIPIDSWLTVTSDDFLLRSEITLNDAHQTIYQLYHRNSSGDIMLYWQSRGSI